MEDEHIIPPMDCEEMGKQNCRDASGHARILETCLEKNHKIYEDRVRQDNDKQGKAKGPYEVKLREKELEKEKVQTLMDIKTEKIKQKEKEEEEVRFRISDVRNNPQEYIADADKRPMGKFWIGLALLLPLSAYVILFYISASYSAFFRKIDVKVDRFAAIFDPLVFSKIESNYQMLIIMTMPFIFMGLGYLIHMFQASRMKQWRAKLILILLVTFVFDAILAYMIEEKIYKATATLTTPDYDLLIAFQEVGFWGIIFAGFVVYIVWGLVFDFVMKEHENLDKVRSFIMNERRKLEELKTAKEKLHEEWAKLKQELAPIEKELEHLRGILAGDVIPMEEYLNCHHGYMKGWLLAINTSLQMPKEVMNELVAECVKVGDDHLRKLGFKQ